MASRFRRRGVWYVKYKDLAGKWCNVSCGVDATAADAEAIRLKWVAAEMNSRHQMPVRVVALDLNAALAKYSATLQESKVGRKKARRSVRREQVVIENFIAWKESRKINNYVVFSKDIAIEYMRELSSRSQATQLHEYRVLKNFFVWSIENHYCATNPFVGIPRPRVTKSTPRFFTVDELTKIYTAAKPPYRDIFRFLTLTGLRIGELGNLEWTDYLREVRLLSIRVMEGNKTKRGETIPLSNAAVNILENNFKAREAVGTADALKYIFVNSAGLKVDNDNIYRNLHRVLVGEKILNASPHTFRHTCASQMAIMGVSLYIIKDVLRHQSIKETEVYAHLCRESVQAAVDKLVTVDTSATTPAPPKS